MLQAGILKQIQGAILSPQRHCHNRHIATLVYFDSLQMCMSDMNLCQSTEHESRGHWIIHDLNGHEEAGPAHPW